MNSPVAMISYSWSDEDAAELLHDELAIRGFEVVHDRHSFAVARQLDGTTWASV
jgi:hypothetical protein